MANYTVTATIPMKVNVSSLQIVEILKEERNRIFGGEENYLFGMEIHKNDENGESVLVKKLTIDEWELAKGVETMINYFYQQTYAP